MLYIYIYIYAKIIRTLVFSAAKNLLQRHEETEQTETDSIQKNCGNVSKMLQETSLQSYLKNYAQVHRGQKLL